MTNSADPDKLASEEANWSGSLLKKPGPTDLDPHTVCKDGSYKDLQD